MKILIVEEHPERNLFHKYYDVPKKVANAVITLLNECANIETDIYTAERETDTSSSTVRRDSLGFIDK